MIRTTSLLAILTTGTMLAGCSDPSPPAPVASVPAVASESPPDQPPAAAGLKDPDEPAVVAKAEPAPIPDGGTFPFPDDAGGKALAKTLAPSAPPPLPVAGPGNPRPRATPRPIADPATAAPTAVPAPPRMPLAPGKSIRPTALPERVPDHLGEAVPHLPPRGELPTGALVRTEGRDVARPADLPILSTRPVPDRASLADPSGEFTARSVISLVLPLRTGPTLFLRFNLPDPFEHAADARPRTPVVEDPNRVLGSVPPPK